MKPYYAALLLSLVTWAQPARTVVSKCLGDACASLEIVGHQVEFIKTGPYGTKRSVGDYLSGSQALVPPTEAPIRILKTRNGLTIVATAFLEQFDEYGPGIRIRILGSRGQQIASDEMSDEEHNLGRMELLNLGPDQVLAIVASGEHAYSAQTIFWLLPQSGSPARVLATEGWLEGFPERTAGGSVEVRITVTDQGGPNTQAGIKHTELWIWNRAQRIFKRAAP
jgi:hypothetical protein